jgi:oligopeptide/dipeptide ABC transporter ATP-binding protein
MEELLLSVRDLTVSFVTESGVLQALDGVSFDIPKGRSVALVGESGSGKSVTAQSILRLIPSPPGRIERGEILLEGRDLLSVSEREMREVRGGRIGIVFQEPMTSLNPVYSVGFQLIEAIRLHRSISRKEARRLAIAGLTQVGFPKPVERIDSYPHELSGGMRQRVLIAIALACEPALLIADEPTTALDATIQAQILELLQNLRHSLGMSLLLISHDLGIVSQIADEIIVMYAGRVVERGPTRQILSAPGHPYTKALLRSIPPVGTAAYRVRGQKTRRLPAIEGTPPDLCSPPPGCRFHPRCSEAMPRCLVEAPPFYETGPSAAARCFLLEPKRGGA